MSKWFVIRADADRNIGYGHMMRCLAFAEWAVQYNIQAIIRN